MKKLTKAQEAQRQEDIAWLKTIIKPGDTLYTILKSVSSSRMSRNIDVYAILKPENGETTNNTENGQGQPRMVWLSRYIARIADIRFNDKKSCLTIGGIGMDMGFEIVYQLGRCMYPDGVEIPGNGLSESSKRDGGYAFKQSWL
jgi:hypothetical protein